MGLATHHTASALIVCLLVVVCMSMRHPARPPHPAAYAADAEREYAEHPWNINNLPRCADSVLRCVGAPRTKRLPSVDGISWPGPSFARPSPPRACPAMQQHPALPLPWPSCCCVYLQVSAWPGWRADYWSDGSLALCRLVPDG